MDAMKEAPAHPAVLQHTLQTLEAKATRKEPPVTGTASRFGHPKTG